MSFKMGMLIIMGFISMSVTGAAQFWEPVNAPIRGSKVLDFVDGKLFTCGQDTGIIGSSNQKVSFYNGLAWDTLVGMCYNGQAFAFAEYKGQLYVGGTFRHIGTPVSNISSFGIKGLARWNGVKFDSIGAFPSGNAIEVHKLIVYNNELYIGGKFQNGGGIGINFIMRYDGTSFYPVGGGITGNFTQVSAMKIYNGDLIVAGSFFTAGGVPVQNIARWNGSQWFAMGNGLGPYIYAMTVDTLNNILYAGGAVGNSGSVPIDRIGWWDGQNWQQVGNGFQAGTSCGSLCMYKGNLYAGAYHLNTVSIKKWDGQFWQLLTSYPTDGGVYALTEFQGSLYASGTFTEIDSVCCYNGNARYTDTTTVSLPHELESTDNSFTIHPNPAKGIISLTFSKSIINRAVIIIYNMKGEAVLKEQRTALSERAEVNLPEGIGSGVYVCKVIGKEVEYSKSFVVE